MADAVDDYFREVTDKLQESEAIAVAIVKQYDATMDDKNGCNQNKKKGNDDNTGNQHQNRPLNDDNKLPEGRINGFVPTNRADGNLPAGRIENNVKQVPQEWSAAQGCKQTAPTAITNTTQTRDKPPELREIKFARTENWVDTTIDKGQKPATASTEHADDDTKESNNTIQYHQQISEQQNSHHQVYSYPQSNIGTYNYNLPHVEVQQAITNRHQTPGYEYHQQQQQAYPPHLQTQYYQTDGRYTCLLYTSPSPRDLP